MGTQYVIFYNFTLPAAVFCCFIWVCECMYLMPFSLSVCVRAYIVRVKPKPDNAPHNNNMKDAYGFSFFILENKLLKFDKKSRNSFLSRDNPRRIN